MTELFVLFCSAQDGESTDMNCLVFGAQCKNGKILKKHVKSIIREFSPFWIIFNNVRY